MTRVVALVIAVGGLVACSKSKLATLPPSPPPEPDEVEVERVENADQADNESILETADRVAAWSADFHAGLVATAGHAMVDIVPQRRSIDTSVVVSLVRERLAQVAVEAASDLLGHLTNHARRPWAHDLLDVVARVAVAKDENRRVVAEKSVRILARQMFASLLVRTRFHDPSPIAPWPTPETVIPADLRPAFLRMLTDWVYWRLSKLDVFADQLVRPACFDDARDSCEALAAKPEAAAITAIDELIRLDAVLDGIQLVARLRALQSDRPFTAQLVLEQLVRYQDVDLSTIAQGWMAPNDPRISELEKKFDDMIKDLNRLRERIAKVLVAPPEDVGAKAKDALKVAPDKLAESLGSCVGDFAKDAINGLTVQLKRLVAGSATDAIELIRDDMLVIDALRLRPIYDDAEKLRDALEELTLIGSHAGALSPTVVRNFIAAAASLANLVAKLEQTVGALEPEVMNRLHGTTESVTAVAGLLQKLDDLARLLGKQDVRAVIPTLKALGYIVRGEVVLPVIEFLEPALEALSNGQRLQVEDLYVALGRIRPTELATALGLTTKLDAECGDDRSWQCWSARLAMLVQGAVRLDDHVLTIDTGQIVQQVADAASASRETRPGHLFPHAAIGAGIASYDGNRYAPIVAEQLGLGVNLGGSAKVRMRAAVFASGVLYRYVLDTHESDGLIVGGAVLLDLYNLVELYGSAGVAISPGNDGPDDAADPYLVLSAGIQVPLGDYLSRIGD